MIGPNACDGVELEVVALFSLYSGGKRIKFLQRWTTGQEKTAFSASTRLLFPARSCF